MGALTEQDLLALPKTDLHCHLDGSLRIETLLDLAEKQNVQLPADDPEKLYKAMRLGERHEDLRSYLSNFDTTLSVMQTEEALYRVAYELAEDAHKENVWYLEVRYAPILHVHQGLSLPTIVESVLSGLNAARRDFGIQSGVIICGIRNQSTESSYLLAELTVAFKNRGVIGFDLAGAEVDHPAKKHREAFYLINNNNVNCTLHAGEAYGPESIAQALHYCGAHRIGHGTRLAEDGDLLNYVNDHRVPLEICISSNLQTGSIHEYSQHPLRFFYDYGIRTTINTDNRLMSDTSVTKELMLMHKHFGFTEEDIREVLVYGFKSAFLPFRDKRDMLERVTKELMGTKGRVGRNYAG